MLTRYTFNFIISVLCVILFSQCKHTGSDNEISDRIVLKIGNAEISEYEFLRRLSRSLNLERATDKQKKNWLKNYVDDSYLLADAIDKGYQSDSIVQKVLHYAAMEMVGSMGGYLWNAVEEPNLKVSNKELEDAYQKRGFLYHIEYLKLSPNFMFEDSLTDSSQRFSKCKKLSKNNPEIEIGTNTYVWPYNEFSPFRDIIFDMKEGEISDMVELQNVRYLFQVRKIEPIPQKSYREEKAILGEIFKQLKAQQIVLAKQHEIKEKAQIQIDDAIANILLEIINEKEKTLLEEEQLGLMSFQFNGKREVVTLEAFLDYYRNNPFSFTIKSKADLIECMSIYIIQTYLYYEAENLGILNEKEYLLDRKNYQNKLIVSQYNRGEFQNQIELSDEEVKDYYTQNQNNYTKAERCEVTFLYFRDKESAYNSLQLVNTFIAQGEYYNLSDTNQIKGLQQYSPGILVNQNSTEFSPQIVNAIFSSAPYELSQPMACSDQYIIFFKKKEEGTGIVSFKEVEPYIRQSMILRRAEQLKVDRLQILKEKYTIEIDETAKLL